MPLAPLPICGIVQRSKDIAEMHHGAYAVGSIREIDVARTGEDQGRQGQAGRRRQGIQACRQPCPCHQDDCKRPYC